MNSRRTTIGFLLLACLPGCSEPRLSEHQVRTASGLVEGAPAAGSGVTTFLGIPYAAPPVGALRWAAPEPVSPWEGVRPATAFGDRCIQTNPYPDMLFQSAGESEDCLSLSIWTPAAEPPEMALPVMVWIHGGGFFSGAHDERRHDGSALAARGVVVVEMNYRLGVFGFLAHPELTAESPQNASGNWGLLDQIAALAWVRDNIGAFGGDPENVTIFGESAGSFSVSALMASPPARGLFHRAIGQSGAYLGNTALALTTLPNAEQRGLDLATDVGAGSLAELRALPPEDLIAAIGDRSRAFVPIIDGHVLAEDPWETYRKGAQHRVPLLAGWTSAEAKVPPLPREEFRARLRNAFPGRYDEALTVFPAADDREAWLSAIALASDNFIGYNTWKWIELHGATGGSVVFRYLFDQALPTKEGPPEAGDPGAAHATDIEFVFNTLDAKNLAWSDNDRRVAAMMGGYWTNFARSGDPNGEGLPEWPAWGNDRRLMRIRSEAAAETESERDRYLFLDRVATERRAR